ncbi:MAG: energy transducer TonB [Vulcanimicrobiaceae bacterium]
MTLRRRRALLVAAILASVLLHLIVAGVVRWPFTLARRAVQIVQIQEPRTLRITHPTPTPAPTARPRPAAPLRRPALHGTQAKARPPRAVATAVPTQTPPPSTPHPLSRAPRCGPVPAFIVATPEPPAISPALRAQADSGTAAVKVQLDAHGRVVGTQIVAGTGNPGLDSLAAEMARRAEYAPATRKCRPVAGSYTFRVQFIAW